jgi:cytidine deaminase
VPIDNKSLESKLASLPRGAAELLGSIMSSSHFAGVISAADAAALALLLGITTQELSLRLLPFAQLYAVAPVSNFHVGAVSMGLSGALYFGANVEVAGQALSFTLHAEQAATSNAWVNGEQGLTSLAVSAVPCGYCRQFLYELTTAATLTILLPNKPPALLTSFLPDPFGPHDLGMTGGLMQAENNGMTVSSPLDPTGTAALAAANASYSPYTSTFAGVALATQDGTVVAGRYAENAAHNPSLSPLEAALSLLVLSGHGYGDICEAVLVQGAGVASQIGATQAVLGSVTGVPLTTIMATKP